MLAHRCTCVTHDDANEHPERPMRLIAILSTLERFGYLNQCVRLESRLTTPAELALVHTFEYMKMFSYQPNLHLTAAEADTPPSDAPNTLEATLEVLRCGGLGFARDTYYNPETTPYAACLSAGSLLVLTVEVIEGRLKDGFALIRPPGHHASQSAGGCVPRPGLF